MFTAQAIGRLGRDAEVKTINQKEYYKFSIAVDLGRDATQWVSILYAKRNDKLADMLRKGAEVYVAGRISVQAYTAKNGQSAAELTIFPSELQFTKYAPRDEESLAGEEEGTDDLPF